MFSEIYSKIMCYVYDNITLMYSILFYRCIKICYSYSLYTTCPILRSHKTLHILAQPQNFMNWGFAGIFQIFFFIFF